MKKVFGGGRDPLWVFPQPFAPIQGRGNRGSRGLPPPRPTKKGGREGRPSATHPAHFRAS
jgi:hypothetical protein